MELDLGQVLDRCISGSVDERQMSEGKIVGFKQENPRDYLFALNKQLSNCESPISVRQIAGILFKNAAQEGDGESIWFSLSNEDRDCLKQSILMLLIDPSEIVRRCVCICVSTIACLELPKKMWDDILTLLTTNCDSEDPIVKKSALTVLCYICEKIQCDVLSIDEKKSITSALIRSLETNEKDASMIEITMEAFIHLIDSIQDIFETSSKTIIIDRVIKHCDHSNEEAKRKSLACLSEIIRYFYPSVGYFMETIKKLTFKIIKEEEDEEVAMQAIEVWCTLCDKETEMYEKQQEGCQHYIKTVSKDLIQLLLEAFEKSYISEWDEEQTKLDASACCLRLLAKTIRDDIIEPVFTFVKNKIIDTSEWKSNFLGLLAFGAILDGLPKEEIIEVLSPVIGTIFHMYISEFLKIRSKASWVLYKIIQSCPEIVTSEGEFEILYSQILKGLKDDLKVAYNSLLIVSELAKHFKPAEGESSSILTPVFPELIEKCVECVYRDDQEFDDDNNQCNKLINTGFDALCNLFENAPEDVSEVLTNSLEFFYNKLVATCETENCGDSKAEEYQCFICITMKTLLDRINTSLDTCVADQIIEAVVNCFNSRKEVFDEGFLLLSALCSKFQKYIDTHLTLIDPYIVHALGTQNSDIVKNACGLISDLCTMVESENIIEKFEEYVSLLLNNVLTNNKLKRFTKPSAISSIGDIILLTKDKFEPMMDRTLKFFDSAAKTSVDIDFSDSDLVEDVVKLQGALIESYTIIIQESSHSNEVIYSKISPYIPDILNFIIKCVHASFNPTLARMKEVCGLIGDMKSSFKDFANYNTPEIQALLTSLSSHSDEEARSISHWVLNL